MTEFLSVCGVFFICRIFGCVYLFSLSGLYVPFLGVSGVGCVLIMHDLQNTRLKYPYDVIQRRTR